MLWYLVMRWLPDNDRATAPHARHVAAMARHGTRGLARGNLGTARHGTAWHGHSLIYIYIYIYIFIVQTKTFSVFLTPKQPNTYLIF